VVRSHDVAMRLQNGGAGMNPLHIWITYVSFWTAMWELTLEDMEWTVVVSKHS
jgi:hypothetical protein